EVRGVGPFTVRVEKSRAGGTLCVLETDKKIEKGPVWIVIAPLEGNIVKGKKGAVMTLTKIKEKDKRGIMAVFESQKGSHKRAEVILDNRGRARNLEAGESYTFAIMEPESFFQAYERKSIPAGGGGRSEPDEVGKKRIEFFTELSEAKEGDFILDCATGIKGYLKHFTVRGGRLVCLNISTPILEKTKEWLSYEGAHFIRYDADLGFPFKDESFDAVVVDALLEYTKDPQSVLKRCAALTRPGGRLLLLEPATSEALLDFYPQDLWEVALWRPANDRKFSRENFEDVLKGEGFELAQREITEFVYPLFSQQRFSQGVAVFKKIFIS
ncbi:MAG: class I SAM-dependent methyltransferase, partial [Candidatus Hydrothermarchaeales archaeon]